MKSAASKPGSMFRSVTADEQKNYVAERAKTKHGAKINNHKAKKLQKGTNMDAPAHLDPNRFELNPNHFKDENDLPVPQIHYNDVKTEARGVALCTVEMAYQFLTEPATISTDALALLLLDAKDSDIITRAGLQPIVIPAKFTGTDEHTLIYGHILQLGDPTVTRESASKDSNPDVFWFKQLRRLQSLKHGVHAAKQSPEAITYRVPFVRISRRMFTFHCCYAHSQLVLPRLHECFLSSGL